MVKKFSFWFVAFGLSFLVQKFGWTTQGKAFFWIWIGVVAFICAFGLFAAFMHSTRIAITAAVIMAVAIGITLFATWVATKLFDVDFYVAFQIMTFGQCLGDEKKDDD